MTMNATPEDVHAALDAAYIPKSRVFLAKLAHLTGDLDLAEDAIHDALAAALEQWRVNGIPENPAGWLFRAARFKAIDAIRSKSRIPDGLSRRSLKSPTTPRRT